MLKTEGSHLKGPQIPTISFRPFLPGNLDPQVSVLIVNNKQRNCYITISRLQMGLVTLIIFIRS